MKKATYINPDKMHIETGHKTFDMQTNYIGPGAVLANTQVSNFIRPIYAVEELKPKEFTKWGELTNMDLGPFRDFGLTQKIEAELKQTILKSRPIILYCFYHTRGSHKIIHGYVCTDMNYKLIKTWVIGMVKSADIIRECKEYVSNVM